MIFDVRDFYLLPVVKNILSADRAICFDLLRNHTLKNSGPSDFGHVDPVGVSAVTAGLTLSPARRRNAKEETGDISENCADFQALTGASTPDAVGVSSEKINARQYPE
ncbi:hypothetical protein [Burkholderia sp. BCC1988]|uniref:hypothetical protein n=1 Tax=Burkholderia sp. BCC1988 TaxID=2817443 RepID=UPI002AB2E91D|nr:hypothetical protein [Burkholderia sp. BCC1988]